MQRNLKDKIKFFSFGLTAGLTIGVVFAVAIKAVLGHFNDLNLGILKLGSKQYEISQRLDSIEGKISNQDKKTVVIPSIKENTKSPEQSAAVKNAGVDTLKRSVDNRDTMAVAQSNDDSNSNVVVMTNELVSVANIPVTDLDSTVSKRSKSVGRSDSMIASMNEMTQDIYPVDYRVEFWQSPLNFKGYKMSLGKIILYGVNSNIPFRLIKWDEVYYLVSNEDAYVVNYTDDAKPFDRVTDRNILKKFSL